MMKDTILTLIQTLLYQNPNLSQDALKRPQSDDSAKHEGTHTHPTHLQSSFKQVIRYTWQEGFEDKLAQTTRINQPTPPWVFHQ